MTRNVRELPHDLLAEKSLLGCLIIDGGGIDEISDLKLKQDDFYHPQYGTIFDAIIDLVGANKPIDYITVCSRLTEKGKLEEVGGQSAIMEIAEEQASSANIYAYGKVVKDKSSLRELVRTAMRVSEMGMDFKGDTQEFFQEVEASFFGLTNEAKLGKCKTQRLFEA